MPANLQIYGRGGGLTFSIHVLCSNQGKNKRKLLFMLIIYTLII